MANNSSLLKTMLTYQNGLWWVKGCKEGFKNQFDAYTKAVELINNYKETGPSSTSKIDYSKLKEEILKEVQKMIDEMDIEGSIIVDCKAYNFDIQSDEPFNVRDFSIPVSKIFENIQDGKNIILRLNIGNIYGANNLFMYLPLLETLTTTPDNNSAAAFMTLLSKEYVISVSMFNSGTTEVLGNVKKIGGSSEGTPNMTSITWSSLKSLRDSSNLIPGMQYRITDYECSTSDPETESAKHQFDIIVTADSESVLNENARAINHSESTQVPGLDIRIQVDNNVKITTASPFYGIVTGNKKELSDGNSYYPVECSTADKQIYTSISEGINPMKTFYDDGSQVSVYDSITTITTGQLYMSYESETGNAIKFISNGTETFDGTIYYKFKNNEHLIIKHLKDFDKITGEPVYDIEGIESGKFSLYALSETPSELSELYMEKDSETLIRIIDLLNETSMSVFFSITSECTPITIDVPKNDYFADSNLKAWKLKYCLDNDKNRFSWADTNNGKGIVYYMKDEWENECGYDFKNIKFKVYKTSEPSSPYGRMRNKYVTANGNNSNEYKNVPLNLNDYKYVYTFDSVIYGDEKDASLGMNPANYIPQAASNQLTTCAFNIVKPCIMEKSFNEYMSGYAVQTINHVVFMTEASSLGEAANLLTYGNEVGNDSRYITFHNQCSDNKVGNSSHHLIFGDFCYNNKIGHDNRYNYICDESSNNTIEDNCIENFIDSDAQGIVIHNNCRGNVIGAWTRDIEVHSGVNYIQVPNGKKKNSSTRFYRRNLQIMSGIEGVEGNLKEVYCEKDSSTSELKGYTSIANLNRYGVITVLPAINVTASVPENSDPDNFDGGVRYTDGSNNIVYSDSATFDLYAHVYPDNSKNFTLEPKMLNGASLIGLDLVHYSDETSGTMSPIEQKYPTCDFSVTFEAADGCEIMFPDTKNVISNGLITDGGGKLMLQTGLYRLSYNGNDNLFTLNKLLAI